MWRYIWYLESFFMELLHFSASTFMKKFEVKVSKPENTARYVLCWFQNFAIWEGAIKPNVLDQGGLFPLCFAVIQLHRAAGSFWLFVESQICHTQNKQIIFELIFFKISLIILPYRAVFNYFLLLWLYACFLYANNIIVSAHKTASHIASFLCY